MDTSDLANLTHHHSHVLAIENHFSCEGRLGLKFELQRGAKWGSKLDIPVNAAVSNVLTE